ncbi:MAG: thiamine-phosphate kinase [Pseudomonadota bacterium]
MASLNEFEIIGKYFAPLTGTGSYGLKDDAAQVSTSKGCALVVTQDAIAEGIHFFSQDPPEMIAKKALRVNLSDLAAKGAKPNSFSIALGLGQRWDEDWIARFAKGLKEDCDSFDIALTGGDTFKSGGGIVISITALGEVPEGEYVSRLGAKAGDVLFVTGTIGDGALGLQTRQGIDLSVSRDHCQVLTERYLLPNPRLQFAECIREFASASMDVSDGLVGDLQKLCSASQVSCEIKLAQIPFSKAASAVFSIDSKYVEMALTGGDDYEILFTVPSERVQAANAAFAKMAFPVTRIGSMNSGAGVRVIDKDGSMLKFRKFSYDHLD